MDLDLTRIFVKVAQNGSFSKAADILQLPKSTVSKSVSRLERETGTKLITRTTRSLTLTAAGRVFYDSSLGPIQALEDAQKSLSGQDSIVSGLVRITAPEDLGSTVIAAVIAKLIAKNPGLSFELQFTDKVVDLIKDGFDIAIRIGRVSESSFKMQRLGEISLVAVASPKYLKGREKITHPRDLEQHDCLTYSNQAVSARWTLKNERRTVQTRIRPRVSANQMTNLLSMAVAGCGIALVPFHLCQRAIEHGQLTQVLPEWKGLGMSCSLIAPLGKSSSARLKVTIDQLAASLKEALSLEVTR